MHFVGLCRIILSQCTVQKTWNKSQFRPTLKMKQVVTSSLCKMKLFFLWKSRSHELVQFCKFSEYNVVYTVFLNSPMYSTVLRRQSRISWPAESYFRLCNIRLAHPPFFADRTCFTALVGNNCRVTQNLNSCLNLFPHSTVVSTIVFWKLNWRLRQALHFLSWYFLFCNSYRIVHL